MSNFGLNNNKYPNFKAMPYDYLMMQQEAEDQGYGIPQPKFSKPEKEENPLPKFYQARGDEFEPQSFREAMIEKDATGLLSPFFEHPLGVLGTWLALGYGMDKFAQACGGEYDKSLIGKAGALGDKLHNSSFAQSKPVKSSVKFISEKTRSGWGWLKEHSALVRAFADTPEKPEWSMVKAMQYNTQEEVVQEFNHIVNILKLNDPTINRQFLKWKTKWNGLIKNHELGLTKEEIEDLKKYFNVKKINEIKPSKISNYILLKRLGDVPEEEIKNIVNTETTNTKVINMINEKMGITPETLKEMAENPSKHYAKVEEIANKFKGKVWCGQGDYKILGPLTKPFQRRIGLDGIANKMHSFGETTHTATGRAFSKALQMFYRGITFGGGKLGALIFIAPGLVKMMKDTKEANRNEKVGTAAWGFIESFLWVITFPLSIGALYGLAGLKNAGMSKEQVEKYREKIKAFNKIADGKDPKKQFKNYEEYKKAKKELKAELKDLRKVKEQNLLTRIIRKVAGVLSIDLNKISSYKNGKTGQDLLRKSFNFLKDCGGVPLKFLFCMMAIMPLIDGVFHKASNFIFGKNYDPEKKEEEKSRKKEQAIYTKQDLQNRLVEIQNSKNGIQSVQNMPAEQQPLNPQSENANLANKNPVNMSGNTTTQTPQIYYNTGVVNQNGVVNPNDVVKPAEFVNNPAPIVNNVYNVGTSTNTIENNDNYTYIPSQNPTNEIIKSGKKSSVDNYTYIPGQNSGVKTSKDTYNENKYIPSQQAISIQKTFDNSGLESALNKADRAEAKALNILAGKFDNL